MDVQTRYLDPSRLVATSCSRSITFVPIAVTNKRNVRANPAKSAVHGSQACKGGKNIQQWVPQEVQELISFTFMGAPTLGSSQSTMTEAKRGLVFGSQGSSFNTISMAPSVDVVTQT
eukprot:scaffold234351_cov16-Tisochrysis_lutea.AAC.1